MSLDSAGMFVLVSPATALNSTAAGWIGPAV